MGKIEESKTLEQRTKTELGFRDISTPLEDKILEEIRKYDVIKGIFIDKEKEEIHEGKKVKIYSFYSIRCNTRGRVFPLDEIVTLNRMYDIIIQNWKNQINPINIDAEIYHNLYKGEKLKINVSAKISGKDPLFKIFNHIICYINNSRNGLYEKINVGSKVLVEIISFKQIRKSGILQVKPLKILTEEDAI